MWELERQSADKKPRICRTISDLRLQLDAARGQGRSIGLVPTMGAFHAGHLSLMKRARLECEVVVVTLFVNPTQFGEGEDLDAYPRYEQRDLELAAGTGANIVFCPDRTEIYPEGFATFVEVEGLTNVLCGSPTSRGASHFRGVTTVVAKLLNITQPDVAYFGQKDFQQTVVIRRMVRDLDIPARITVCPTVREDDGLAMSSRNAYLSADDRRRATALKRALDAAAANAPDVETMRSAATAELSTQDITPEYVEILAADDLAPVEDADIRPVVIAIAARVGGARLIDNLVIDNTGATNVVSQRTAATAAVA